MSIPNVLHLTSKDVPLRGIERSMLARSRKALGPGWTAHVWSDAQNDDLMAAHFPQFLDAFRALPYGVMRADVARLAYLFVEGGWYGDTDYEWLHSPAPAAAAFDIVLPLSLEGDTTHGDRLGNAVFGSVAGHPFWVRAIEGIFESPIPANLKLDAIEKTTGPEYITELLPYARQLDRAWLAPKRSFHGGSTLVGTGDEPFGLHLTRGSWRPNSLRWRLRMVQRQAHVRLRQLTATGPR